MDELDELIAIAKKKKIFLMEWVGLLNWPLSIGQGAELWLTPA
jgi:hypothetical protein